MPSKRLQRQKDARSKLIKEDLAQCTMSEELPPMGRQAVEMWEAPLTIPVAPGLDAIFCATPVQEEVEKDPYEGLNSQAECIAKACDDLKQLLLAKNETYGGSAFQDVEVMGQFIEADTAIMVRIADKLRRLTSGCEYPQEDTLADLAGYIILRNASRIWRKY